MSQVTIGVTDDTLARIDAQCAHHRKTREELAQAGLEAELARLESISAAPAATVPPKPLPGKPAGKKAGQS